MFCGYSKHHVWIRGSGVCSPCPVYDLRADPIGEHLNVERFFHSEEMQRLREDLTNDIKRPGCHVCWEDEKTGYSTRTWANERIFVDKDAPTRLTALEISAGRTCTLKCRMCGPDSSTAWASEMSQRGKGKEKPTLDWGMVPRHLLGDLTYLKITGGEPFLSPNLATLFAELHKAGISQNIDVDIFTNVEEFPNPQFIDNMRDFKSLQVYFSIDGVGARNEYIRSGSSWTRTVDNIIRWGRWKHDMKLERVRFHISHTYTLFNCLYYYECVDFVREMRKHHGLESLTLHCGSHMALDDSWHSVPRLPQSVKDELIDIATVRPKEYIIAMNDDHGFWTSTVRNALKWQKYQPPTKSFDDWWTETTELDRVRGQDIRQALPEVVDMLRRHGLVKD